MSGTHGASQGSFVHWDLLGARDLDADRLFFAVMGSVACGQMPQEVQREAASKEVTNNRQIP